MFTEKFFAATIIFATMSSTPSANEILEIAEECGISVTDALDVARDVFHARSVAMGDIAADMAAQYATENANF